MLPVTRFVSLPAFATQAQRSVTCPKGYVAAGVACGLKKKGRLDLGLLVSLRPAVSAATFTSNAAAAAPVRLTRETSACDRLQGVVVNAGNANACTGRQGLGDAARMRLLAAQHLRLPVELVAVASTGVIGVPLDMGKVEPGIAAAAAAMKPGGGEHFSQAIRTTDSSPKRGALELETADGVVRLGAAAKGCGMISPRMATMLCFVTCDAAVGVEDWRRVLAAAVEHELQPHHGRRSGVDQRHGRRLRQRRLGRASRETGLGQLAEALDAMLLALAVGMVADGEGATKAVRLTVEGARDAGEAERVARAVADSPLVKTALLRPRRELGPHRPGRRPGAGGAGERPPPPWRRRTSSTRTSPSSAAASLRRSARASRSASPTSWRSTRSTSASAFTAAPPAPPSTSAT